MDARIEASVRDWTPRTCKPGFHGLRELADAGFSGAVDANGARLFMLNGRIVGVSDGTIDAFEDAALEAHEALDTSLPLLFSMLESGGAVEAEYYTGDTSIAEVNETLSSGTFTGYVELSENVLSGDYYLVYYGGKSMSVAFVGASERLVTGDEALAKADDEVGIYSVVSVDVDLIDIPDEPDPGSDIVESDARSVTASDDATASDSDDATASDGETANRPDDTAATARTIETDDVDETNEIEDVDETVETNAPDDRGNDATDRADETTVSASGTDRAVAETEDSSTTSPATRAADKAEVSAAETPRRDVESDASGADSNDEVGVPADETEDAAEHRDERATVGADGKTRSTDGQSTGAAAESLDGATTAEPVSDDGPSDSDPRSESAVEAEKRWQETYTIPALDPNRAASPTRDQRTEGGASSTRTTNRADHATDEDAATVANGSSETTGGEESVDHLNQEIATLQEQLATAQTERDDAERARDRLEQTVRELRESIERLEDAAGSQSADGKRAQSATGESLAPAEALAGTNLFVRYSSKGKPTLSDARSGAIDREAVDQNLRLERHTHFESDTVSVDGQQFSSFLEGTIEYQFVEWIVRDLLYEIQETGNEGQLRELFEAIMEIDRAEFDGSVSVRYTEDGDEHRELCSFDVVLRNPMGHPLIVANVNDSRDPATGDMLADLVSTAGLVAGTSDSFGCAIYVTASFFEPEALETAAEATSSGFFGGGSKESFVRVSRKQGYHLCLVESRDGAFYVNVPEL